eukprot:2400989-Rhodomonas_salina.1
MGMQTGEKCFVTLGGFSKDVVDLESIGLVDENENDNILPLLVSEGDLFFDAIWSTDGFNPVIEIEYTDEMDLFGDQTVVFPEVNGIRIPAEGVSDANLILFQCETANGPVPPTRFGDIQSVGKFAEGGTEITFTNPRAGEPTQIGVVVQHQSMVAVGEYFELELPGFFVAGATGPVNLDVVGLSGPIFSGAIWDPVAETLRLMVALDIPAGQLIQVTIPASAGLRLPTNGVREGQDDLKISTNAAAGPVLPVSFSGVEAVGSFDQNSALTLDPPVAG